VDANADANADASADASADTGCRMPDACAGAGPQQSGSAVANCNTERDFKKSSYEAHYYKTE
jgi:hypothetical protein